MATRVECNTPRSGGRLDSISVNSARTCFGKVESHASVDTLTPRIAREFSLCWVLASFTAPLREVRTNSVAPRAMSHCAISSPIPPRPPVNKYVPPVVASEHGRGEPTIRPMLLDCMEWARKTVWLSSIGHSGICGCTEP